jgi:hypothetical protein
MFNREEHEKIEGHARRSGTISRMVQTRYAEGRE